MWKQVSFKGTKLPYLVSEFGTVISLHFGKAKILKFDIDKDGYYRVTLRINKKSKHFGVHQVVAMTFLYNSYRPGMVVNHKDGNKKNNVVDNLEYIYPIENDRHASIYGLKAFGKRNILCKYSDDLVLMIAENLDAGIKPPKIAKMFNIPITYVYQIKYGMIRKNLLKHFKFAKSWSSTTIENQYYKPLRIVCGPDK